MSKDQFRAPDYLEHILSAIKRIKSYTQGINKSAFLENEQIQDAVLRNIEIIGEAARNIEKILSVLVLNLHNSTLRYHGKIFI